MGILLPGETVGPAAGNNIVVQLSEDAGASKEGRAEPILAM